MDENPQDSDATDDHLDAAGDPATDPASEVEPDPDAERDIPHNDDLQDPAGVGTELTHDQFDLGRSARIN